MLLSNDSASIKFQIFKLDSYFNSANGHKSCFLGIFFLGPLTYYWEIQVGRPGNAHTCRSVQFDNHTGDLYTALCSTRTAALS